MSVRKKIFFIAPYPVNKAPSQRLKYEQYYSFFQEAGYETTTSSFVGEKFWKIIYKPGYWYLKVFYTLLGYLRRVGDLFRLRQYDIVYIHLWVTPLGIPFFEWLYCLFAKKVVYDIDDLIFLGHSSNANRWSEFLKGKNKAIYLMKRANHVITCTPMLDGFVRKYNSNTTDISSTINTSEYLPRENYAIERRKIRLGWSGSHSTSRFLFLLSSILKELKQEFDFTLFVIGNDNFKIEGLDVEAIKWNADTEVVDLSKIDIGLYPLPDEKWVYGKSGLKALQYMALGIPTIATAIGANFRIINNGENGFLVHNEEEWKAAIRTLVKDEVLRKKMGENARKTIEQKFSLTANKHLYLEIFEKLC